MIKKMVVALVVGATLLTTGCGTGWADSRDSVTGTLVSKEYESRNCERRSGLKCKKWDPAEWELTILQADGKEVELVVTQYDYNNATEGFTGTWKGRID